MKEIPLTQGYAALVDDEDYERVGQYKWRSILSMPRTDGSVVVYAARWSRRVGGRRSLQMLHRVILGVLQGATVDHINGNGLDNRRINLRTCTTAENAHNQVPQVGGTSAFKGVCWNRAVRKWQAQIKHGGRKKYLGVFASEQDAAKAYDVAANKYFGAFARINFKEAPHE